MTEVEVDGSVLPGIVRRAGRVYHRIDGIVRVPQENIAYGTVVLFIPETADHESKSSFVR